MIVYTYLHYDYPKLDLQAKEYIELGQRNQKVRKPIQILYDKKGVLIFKGNGLFDYQTEAYFVATVYQEENYSWYINNLFMLTTGDTEIEWFGVKMQVNYIKHLRGGIDTRLFKSLKIEGKPIKLATTASALQKHKRIIGFYNEVINLKLAKGKDRYIIVGNKIFDDPVIRVKPRKRMLAVVNDTAVFFNPPYILETADVLALTEKYIYLEKGIYDFDGEVIAFWDLDEKGVKVEFEDGAVVKVSRFAPIDRNLGVVKINDMPVDKPRQVGLIDAKLFKGIPSKNRRIVVHKFGMLIYNRDKIEYWIKDGLRFKAINNPPLEEAIYVYPNETGVEAYRETKRGLGTTLEPIKIPQSFLKRVPFWLAEIKI